MRIYIVALALTACTGMPSEGPDGAIPDAPVGNDAGSSDAPSDPQITRTSSSYPAYAGGTGSYSCSADVMQPIEIAAPVAPAGTKLPLLIWFPGTLARANDEMSMAVTLRAAQLGFVAAAVEYKSWDLQLWPDRMDAKQRCFFASDISADDHAIAQLCAHPQVDCNLGIVVAGHSQGGVMAMLAKNYDDRVRAAYVVGMGTGYDASPQCTNWLAPGYNVFCNMVTNLFPYVADPARVAALAPASNGPALGSSNRRVLASDHISVEVGEEDPFFTPLDASIPMRDHIATAMNNVIGAACPTGASCLPSGGGRWFLVDEAQLDASMRTASFEGAGHCFMSAGTNLGCTQGTWVPDGNYFAKGSTAPWTLDANLTFLRGFTGPQ